MTDEQFKTLRSIQFAQLALLQSIEANIRLVAQQQKAPGGGIGLNWKETHNLLEKVRTWRQRGPENP